MILQIFGIQLTDRKGGLSIRKKSGSFLSLLPAVPALSSTQTLCENFRAVVHGRIQSGAAGLQPTVSLYLRLSNQSPLTSPFHSLASLALLPLSHLAKLRSFPSMHIVLPLTVLSFWPSLVRPRPSPYRTKWHLKIRHSGDELPWSAEWRCKTTLVRPGPLLLRSGPRLHSHLRGPKIFRHMSTCGRPCASK